MNNQLNEKNQNLSEQIVAQKLKYKEKINELCKKLE